MPPSDSGRRLSRVHVLAWLLCSWTAHPVLAQRPAWANAVDSIMQRALAESGIPGGQVAIVERGRVAYAAGYGVADIETGRAVTDRTLFQITGTTSLFTAALLTELQARKSVDLDAPIRRYVPEIPGSRVGGATMRGLLSMTSGWVNISTQSGRDDEAALSDLYATLGDTVVMTEPGRVFSYSNHTYSMAGLAAERATRTRFADLMDSVILRPLGLPYASYRQQVITTRDFSQPHIVADDRQRRVRRPPPNFAAAWPSGFLYASASEVARLASALMADGKLDGRQVLHREAVRELQRGVIDVPEVPADSFALGMHVTHGLRRVWEKGGGMPGFENQVTMWPDDQFAVVVSFNLHPDIVPRVVTAIAQRVASVPPPATVDLTGERDPTPEERAALAGKYGQQSVTSEYFEQDGKLMMRIANNTMPVRVTADGRHVIVRSPAGPPRVSAIVRDSTGAVRYLVRDSRAYRKF